MRLTNGVSSHGWYLSYKIAPARPGRRYPFLPVMSILFRGRQVLTLVALALPAVLQAQSLPAGLSYSTYDWEARRKPMTLTTTEAQNPALILRELRVEEYALDAKRELHLYSLDHHIVRVNTSEGIERYNKIYLPVQDGGKVLSLKARTISPRGEVVEIDAANMKELKDQDGGRGFKIFAVEGLEKGSEIEYLFTRERPANYFGRNYMQDEVPARDVTFELITPEFFTFEARRYPSSTSVVLRDTVQNEKRIVRLALHDVPAAREETFANIKAERQRVEYKMAYSQARGRERLFTWADASQFLYRRVYGWTKDEQKAVDKLLKQMALPATNQVVAAEQYIKKNFRPDDSAGEDLAHVITTRTGSEVGMARLYAAIFNRLNITHELVVTSDRTDAAFDKEFDSWNYLDHFVFFFTSTKQWLAPGRPDYRMPLIPAEWTANEALFVRTVKLGSTETAIGSTGFIPTLAADQSPSDLDIAVQFAPNLDKSTVTIRETLGGYHAQQIQPFYGLIPDEKRTEVLQELIKSNVPDATFQQIKATNIETGLNPLEKPFIVDATVESVALLDRAGPKYLFKVGTLLGPQSELYQADDRQYDVENDFNRRYNRTITFELPAGYQVRNLNDLNVDISAGPTDKGPEYLFKSSYEQQGQKVIVTIREYYRQIRWPKKDFEAFRGVVNAAANFNKVVLVLEKKG